MIDLIKKSMLTGIGLALKTWDEVEALGKELEEKGKMPREEAKKFIEELQNRYEETQAKLEERVEKSVRELLKKSDIVTGEDLKALKTEIRDLKKLISEGSATDGELNKHHSPLPYNQSITKARNCDMFSYHGLS